MYMNTAFLHRYSSFSDTGRLKTARKGILVLHPKLNIVPVDKSCRFSLASWPMMLQTAAVYIGPRQASVSLTLVFLVTRVLPFRCATQRQNRL